MPTPGDWLGLDGKVCVVTGAGGGIGRATALHMAQVGARPVLLDRDADSCAATQDALRAVGVDAPAIQCDVADAKSVTAAAQRCLSEVGPADILVNNAGLLRAGPLASLPVEEWNRLLSVNLTGYFLCAQAFGAQMLERKAGAIVHIASIASRFPQPASGA